MAAAATGTATTATATRSPLYHATARRAEDGKLAFHLRTGAGGTGCSLARRENKLLESVVAMTTSVFVNGHGLLPISRFNDSPFFFAFYPLL